MTKRFLFVILTVFLGTFSPFGQSSSDLRRDLALSFQNYELNSVSPQQTRTSGALTIDFEGKSYRLRVSAYDLRAARWRAEDTSMVGVRQLERTSAGTFKGLVNGDSSSSVRLTVDENGVEGFFSHRGERLFVEPASRYSSAAKAGDVVVYRAEDVLRNTSFHCPQDLAEELRDARQNLGNGQNVSPAGLKTIELATEADYDFVLSTNANANDAVAKQLSILNMVEGLFEEELGLTIRVVYQHTWSVPDPFNGANTDLLLNSFQSYWNTNYPVTLVPRDAAHLFTYKPNARAQGYAFVGVMCNNPSFAYGLSGRIFVEWGWEQANFLVTAHELAHNLGATHSDANPTCANTLMNAQLSGSTQFTFCSASAGEVGSHVTVNGACLTPRAFARLDFDGDGRTDFSIFRPSVGEWWINRSSTQNTFAAQFGNAEDRVVSADFTGDGQSDIAIFRPSNGNWFILRSEDFAFYAFPFGTSGDLPAPADYDGDGRTDPAVFRPSTGIWYVDQSSGAGTAITQFGQAGDVAVPSDYDGDGRADVAIFRPSVGQWWVQRSSGGAFAVTFGNSTDRPVAGDYTGDGKSDVAIFRPSDGNWFILRSEDFLFYSFPFGANGDLPAPGDYDGDGRFDAAVFRPSAATWYVNGSTSGTQIRSFGSFGDQPLPTAYVP